MRSIQRWRQPRPIDWLWPLLACFAGWRFIILRLHDPVPWDGQYTYLPAARDFLQQGWGFLLTQPSCRVAPLGYLWPALWGADPTLIRIANMGLWAGCVWFLWRACCLVGGWRAGLVAMVLMVLSDLTLYFPSEMTEPVYLFGVFGLIHALARLVAGQDRTLGAVTQGAVMLTLTLLSRPILELIAPAALLACLIALAWWAVVRPKDQRGDWPATVSRVALSLGLGLLLPLAVVVMNGLASGFWGLRTGAGLSLYLGTHPLFQGTEPAFLGFDFDDNALLYAMTGNEDAISMVGGPVARAAALWQIQNMPVTDAIAFFGRKLWWWLAEHPAEMQRSHSPLRQLRLFDLATIVVAALWAGWGWRRLRRPATAARSYAAALVSGPAPGQWAFAGLLLGMFVLLTGQLLPVFYNSRYGVTMLDPWLIPLTAFCVALLTDPVQLRGGGRKNQPDIAAAAPRYRSILTAGASFVVIVAITTVTYSLARRFEHTVVEPRHIGAVTAHVRITDTARVHATGMSQRSERQWVIMEPSAALLVDLDQSDVEGIGKLQIGNALWDTEIALGSTGTQQKQCGNAEVAYQTAAGTVLQPAYKLPLLLPLTADGQFHHLVTHANTQLRPKEAGSLRIVLNCPVGTLVEWRETRFLESRYPWDAAAHIKR